MDFPDAKKMRQIAQQMNEANDKTNYEFVLPRMKEFIVNAANKGEFEIEFKQVVKDCSLNVLKKLQKELKKHNYSCKIIKNNYGHSEYAFIVRW